MTSKENDDNYVPLMDKIEGILKEKPSKESLFTLLKLATPALTEKEMKKQDVRAKALNKLKLYMSAYDPKNRRLPNDLDVFVALSCKRLESDSDDSTASAKENDNDDDASISDKFQCMVLKEKPSKESLFKLLKLFTPELTENDMMKEDIRTDAINTLSRCMAEYNHRNPQASIDLEAYVARCCKTLQNVDDSATKTLPITGKRKANPNSPETFYESCLNQIASILSKDHSKESLLEILKLVLRYNTVSESDLLEQSWRKEAITSVLHTLKSYGIPPRNCSLVERFMVQCGKKIDQDSSEKERVASPPDVATVPNVSAHPPPPRSVAKSLPKTRKRKTNPNSPETLNESSLNKILSILSKDHSKESLVEILKLVLPWDTVSESDLLEQSRRKAAITSALHTMYSCRISPRNLSLVEEFMVRCGEKIDQDQSQKQRVASPPDVPTVPNVSAHPPPPRSVPNKFHVTEKWPFLKIETIHPTRVEERASKGVVAALHCINARGTIAHEQQVEAPFTTNGIDDSHSVVDIFNKIGVGVKHLLSVEAIQKELVENGPVVSLSFVPRVVYPMASHPAALIPSAVPEKHEVLIVGWERRGFAWFWLVKRLHDGTRNDKDEPLRIAMGQFGIDKECVAPMSSFLDTCWQHGPHLNVFCLPEGWMKWPRLSLKLHKTELEQLCINPLKSFVVRDKERFAHSRRYELTAMHRINGTCLVSLYLDQMK